MSLRSLPSVDRLIQSSNGVIAAYGRSLTVDAIRSVLDETRTVISAGGETPPDVVILKQVEERLKSWTKATLLPVINATGVILHTNLGRAPLSQAACKAMDDVSRGYSNIEFDLETGKRGSRLSHAQAVIQKLTGAEAALVVNNCASAVLLVLSALANRKTVIISRSQLVEIGGGFRIPDIMKQSGGKLAEIGATNKVRLADYEEALVTHTRFSASNEAITPLVMRAHRSNFKMIGFTEEPELANIIETSHRHAALFIDDLGSGALLDTARFGMEHEPTVSESLEAGADLVMFSGDKLLGGPQAGIIAGKKALVEKIKKHPLARVLRADKTCLAGLTATLLHYLKNEAELEIPIWRMIALPIDQINARAEYWRERVGCGEVLRAESTVGGGSLPGNSLATRVLALQVKSADKFLAKLRAAQPPVIARTENERVVLDPRTVLPEQDEALIECLNSVLLASGRERIDQNKK